MQERWDDASVEEILEEIMEEAEDERICNIDYEIIDDQINEI